jgi:hypothetical protein
MAASFPLVPVPNTVTLPCLTSKIRKVSMFVTVNAWSGFYIIYRYVNGLFPYLLPIVHSPGLYGINYFFLSSWSFLASFPYSEIWKLAYLISILSVCLCIHPVILRMPEPIFMKLGTYIMARERILTVYFINPFHHSACLCVYPLIVARQRLSRNVITATNTHTTLEDLLDVSSMRSVSYQRKVGDQFFPELLVYYLIYSVGGI